MPPSSVLSTAIVHGRGEALYFRGTFVPIEFLWKYLAEGEEIVIFLVGFPQVSREQVVAVLQEAGQRLVEAYSAHERSL